MIPGSISKVSEGQVNCADRIKVYNDFVHVFGTGTINWISPGLGTAQGQFLMLVPRDGDINLGTNGNISGGMKVKKLHVAYLVYSKPLQMWLLSTAVPSEDEEENVESVYIPFDPANFVADGPGAAWVPRGDLVYGNMYYIHGKRVTINVVIGWSSITPAGGVRTIRMRLPQAVSNIAVQGPFGGSPSSATGFVGSSIVSTDIDAITPNALPTYCGVGHLPTAAPWPNISITSATGNFPATPTNGFVILATATYILEG